MKIDSDERLNYYLDADLAWRKKELSSIKFLIDSSDESNYSFYSRIGIVFLYAHWEGYIKKAGNCYLDYIRSLDLVNSDLTENLLAFSMKIDICRCCKSKKTSLHHEIIDTILNKSLESAKFPLANDIDTKSNLDYDTLKEILFSLGLDYSQFETKENEINEKLLDLRNIIAHGNRDKVSPDQFNDIYEDILYLMELFRTQITNSVENKSYLRKELDPN